MTWLPLTVFALAWVGVPVLYGIRLPGGGARPAGLGGFEFVRINALIVALFSLWQLSTGEFLQPRWLAYLCVVALPGALGLALRGHVVDEDVLTDDSLPRARGRETDEG